MLLAVYLQMSVMLQSFVLWLLLEVAIQVKIDSTDLQNH